MVIFIKVDSFAKDYSFSSPSKGKRILTGILVLFFLALLLPLVVLIKKEYWKDLK